MANENRNLEKMIEFIDDTKRALKENNSLVIVETHGYGEGIASYRAFSSMPSIQGWGEDFHADRYHNREIIISAIHQQPKGQLKSIARVIDAYPIVTIEKDSKGDPRVIRAYYREQKNSQE